MDSTQKSIAVKVRRYQVQLAVWQSCQHRFGCRRENPVATAPGSVFVDPRHCCRVRFSRVTIGFSVGQIGFSDAEISFSGSPISFTNAGIGSSHAQISFSNARIALSNAKIDFSSAKIGFSSDWIRLSSAKVHFCFRPSPSLTRLVLNPGNTSALFPALTQREVHYGRFRITQLRDGITRPHISH
jgi:hypothetical protein